MKLKLGRKQMATVAIVAGAAIGGAGIAAAATGNTTPANPVTPAAPATSTDDQIGVDHSNNDPAHEAGEPADREAAETPGRSGGNGDHHSNTDAAHEASESPERAAQEAADDTALAAGTASTGG